MPWPKQSLIRLAAYSVALSLVLGACGPTQTFTPLTTDDPVAELPQGLSVSANPALMPDGFGLQLSAVSAEDFAAGQGGEAWAAALAALPAYLQLKSAVFGFDSNGAVPEELFVSVVVPAGADGKVLDLYSWNGAAWNFLPAQARGGQLVAVVNALPVGVALFQAAGGPPLAYTLLEPGQDLSPAVAETANAVLLGGVLALADGTLAGQLPGVPLDQSYAVYPVVRTYAEGLAPDPALLTSLLGSEDARANHMQILLSFAGAAGYDGLVLDYAGVTPELGPAFAQFVHDLAAQLHSQGKSFFVQVEAPVVTGDALSTAGYDWRALGAAADAVFLPFGNDPTVYGGGLAETVLAWAVGEVPRGRLRLMTSSLSVESVAGEFLLIDEAAALAPLGSVAVDTEGGAEALAGEPLSAHLSGDVQSVAYDARAFAASYAYTDAAGQTRTVWLTSGDTLRQRLALAQKFQLGGVVVDDLLFPGVPGELVNALTQYKASVQAEALAEAGVLWTVKNAGDIVDLATAQPNQAYVYVPPSAGQYEFSASLQHGGHGSLGSAAVRVAAITPTVTPPPTVTATRAVVSGGTAVPQATQGAAATAVPTSSGGSGVFVPPPPIGAGTFELGGQAPGGINHLTEMQSAGMSWVKFQTRSGGGDFISAAHGAGFKVLLSVIGDKGRVMDPAYRAEYAGWVAGLAAAGADAIEVWNEPNIEHEWPEGQISAASYTQLLQQSYNAIKAANGGTIVISGGPAPTGAEGAFPGKVVNDDRFLREMAAAGAANYMDCIGAHFNQGTTSPNASSGAPLLNGYHYSYYFWPMVDTYWNAFGGTRPVCFTELGFLTGDGFGALPGGFAWAAETSLAEHAQWLAEAASLAGNSGKVRLMVVWNVDFTFWGGDPQAGYAMIRPDGSCPACASLGAVMP